MCGICGELRFDGLSADPVTLERMLVRLVHRGPDNEGKYLNRQLALGHRRLSIIDLSAASNQPLDRSRTGASIGIQRDNL